MMLPFYGLKNLNMQSKVFAFDAENCGLFKQTKVGRKAKQLLGRSNIINEKSSNASSLLLYFLKAIKLKNKH